MEETIDIEKIKEQNEQLQKLIQPAIDAYYDETGLIPSISISQTKDSTACGILYGAPIVKVNAII